MSLLEKRLNSFIQPLDDKVLELAVELGILIDISDKRIDTYEIVDNKNESVEINNSTK